MIEKHHKMAKLSVRGSSGLSGLGLRSLLDTYVYLRKVPLDMAYVASEIEKLGITDFEAANRSLALHLFDGGG